MCNLIQNDGLQCQLSPTIDRCYRHPENRFPPPINFDSVQDAEEIFLIILKTRIYDEIQCLCGVKTKRYNFTYHCKTPKHKAWVTTMPKPKTTS